MLPRVPEVSETAFRAFTDAGRELFHLHADYEDAILYPLEVVGGERPPLGSEEDYYRVQKMRFPSGMKAADEPDSLVMNGSITVKGIPGRPTGTSSVPAARSSGSSGNTRSPRTRPPAS